MHFPRSTVHVMATALLAAATCLVTPARAQEFPDRAVTFVVPFAPGGPDRVLRAIADKLQLALRQPVVLDYKPGATGLIGAGIVQRARPDGHTLLFTSNSSMVVAPLLRQPPPFDAAKDFVPVTMIMRYPMFLAVPPKHPASNVAEFVAWVKANAASANYGSPGVGSVGQLATEVFAKSAGVAMTHVPFKGIGEAQTALMTGDVQLFLDGPVSSAELVRGGKVKALAVTGDKRISAFPHIPSMREAGFPAVSSVVWIGIFAPKGTPEPVARRLSEEIARIVKTDEVREQIAQGGLAEAVGSTPQELAQALEAETPGFAQLVRELNLRVE
ncbi:MAG TPA: tripartite tricarboxylate transporter substrate binding protein [Ramlibacter sp.]|nr:tripartite tricarboxylate transporter substrate binding protein [Ramlibacter sp.]